PRPQHRGDQPPENDGPPCKHGKHRSIEHAYEHGPDAVQKHSESKATGVERVKLRGPEREGLCVDSCGEKIKGIPDASSLQDSIETSQYGHGNASGQSAF